ncbi:MAG: ribosome biogenesis factor YjgA [Betaproteobacteria bacterium]
MEEEFEDEDYGPSKSEIKRQMLVRQELAQTLSELSTDSIKTLPIEENFMEKLLETHKIKTFGAIKRHKMYLGKMIRALDEDEINAIRERLDALQGLSKVETAKLHHIEQLRDKLLKDEQSLTALISQYPDVDIQPLRTMIRNARKERELNKPPKAYREIFQFLKNLDELDLS